MKEVKLNEQSEDGSVRTVLRRGNGVGLFSLQSTTSSARAGSVCPEFDEPNPIEYSLSTVLQRGVATNRGCERRYGIEDHQERSSANVVLTNQERALVGSWRYKDAGNRQFNSVRALTYKTQNPEKTRKDASNR